MDPKKMGALMKQMGIKQDSIDAKRVIIERDEGNLVIENPTVNKITMQGQESFQIMGEVVESFQEKDLELIMDKTGADKEAAKKALEEAKGDIAEAIIKLS